MADSMTKREEEEEEEGSQVFKDPTIKRGNEMTCVQVKRKKKDFFVRWNNRK